MSTTERVSLKIFLRLTVTDYIALKGMAFCHSFFLYCIGNLRKINARGICMDCVGARQARRRSLPFIMLSCIFRVLPQRVF